MVCAACFQCIAFADGSCTKLCRNAIPNGSCEEYGQTRLVIPPSSVLPYFDTSQEKCYVQVLKHTTKTYKNNIFLGIDGGKWYDAKRKLIPIASTSSAVTIEDFQSNKWTKFPAQPIPHYVNKGHIYIYIVGTHFETEDYEAGEITGITEKPFRRGTQYVDSDHIHKVYDAKDGK
ncbi:hypothetical protein RN001_001924 [Aquatica leii]|uniref:Uncharacterized protein n=1 Tax=Aquatica leii TaxID=1421715 RepID=A0AAN7PGP9_9COLE|nr:hypothetical protein RN001_001924 [Aquatica leii]